MTWVTMPVHQLNGAISGVAFSSLSRNRTTCQIPRFFPQRLLYARILDHPDHNQLRSVCRRDSPRSAWRQMDGGEAAPIFRYRLLVPTALLFALVNPLSWLVMSTGRVGRTLFITAATTPWL